MPVGHHGDGFAIRGFQRAAMGGTINAQRQAAGDGKTIGRQIGGPTAGMVFTAFGHTATADYRQLR
jgi:hypothetical protein